MACFIVPGTEAIVTTIVEKKVKHSEKEEIGKISFSTKLGWLNKMLWGGSALLAFEHIWHGEVTPFFPFLTAVENGETMEMLGEMATVGVTMAVAVTAIWGGMVAISNAIEKRSNEKTEVGGAE